MTGCAWALLATAEARRSPTATPRMPKPRLPTMRSSPERPRPRGIPTRKIPRNSKRLVPDIGVVVTGFRLPLGMWRPVAVVSAERAAQAPRRSPPCTMPGEGRRPSCRRLKPAVLVDEDRHAVAVFQRNDARTDHRAAAERDHEIDRPCQACRHRIRLERRDDAASAARQTLGQAPARPRAHRIDDQQVGLQPRGRPPAAAERPGREGRPARPWRPRPSGTRDGAPQ